MKTITIGRGDGADILIDDEMISRRHALIRISTFGKMELVDMGKNGTFVNGVKLRPNVPFPIKRKDIVNFANVAKLDWSLVPDNSRFIKTAIAALAALIVIVIAIIAIRSCDGSSSDKPATPYEYQSSQPSGATAAPQEQSSEESSNSEEKGADKKDGNKKDDTKGKTLKELFPEKPAAKKPAPKKSQKPSDNSNKTSKAPSNSDNGSQNNVIDFN